MKFTINRLRIGDVIEGRVVEKVSDREFIVEFHGDLLRIVNETPLHFEDGQRLRLKVRTVKPLGFQILAAGPRGLDLKI